MIQGASYAGRWSPGGQAPSPDLRRTIQCVSSGCFLGPILRRSRIAPGGITRALRRLGHGLGKLL
eukprot:5080552-Prorocentrum_lima.AAC.1